MAGGKRKAGGGPAEQPPASGGGGGAAARKRKRNNEWPWWMWAIGGVAVIVCAGQLLAPKDSSSKKGKGGGKGKGGPSTERFLELALRLQEMTDLGSQLNSANALDGEAAQELNKELTGIEAELEGSSDSISRDLLSMVSVVRGTLYQKSANLTDEQVQELNRSFTYANPNYWDDYYNKTSDEERFDWYGSWDTAVEEVEVQFQKSEEGEEAKRPGKQMGDLLKPYLTSESKILMLGCGNSDMSAQMYQHGFEDILNVDISENLLEKLRQKLSASAPRMRWQYANASALDFPEKSFDVIIDKGTFDAMEQNKPLVAAAFREAHRTLRPGGFLLSVTFNTALQRVDNQLRQADDWGDCRTITFERPSSKQRYHLHACQREH